MGWRGPMTHRQFLAWQEWLLEDWNRPDKTDHYLMEVACEVRRVLSGNPRNIRLDHFRLKFGESKPAMTREQAAAASRSKWLGIVTGGDPNVKVRHEVESP
jgi:hypothetical protein